MILKYQQSLILLAKSVLSSNLGKVPSQLWTTLVLVTGITIINMISSLLAVLHHSFLLSFSLVNLNDINENSNVRYPPPPQDIIWVWCLKANFPVCIGTCVRFVFVSQKSCQKCLKNLAKVCIFSQSSLCIWGTMVKYGGKKKKIEGVTF